MNNDFLTQAIADAKSIRETALANARQTLLEQFDSGMTRVLADKLKEDVGDDENADINIPTTPTETPPADTTTDPATPMGDVANVNITATDDRGNPMAINNQPPVEDDQQTDIPPTEDIPATDEPEADVDTGVDGDATEDTLNSDELDEILKELAADDDTSTCCADIATDDSCDDDFSEFEKRYDDRDKIKTDMLKHRKDKQRDVSEDYVFEGDADGSTDEDGALDAIIAKAFEREKNLTGGQAPDAGSVVRDTEKPADDAELARIGKEMSGEPDEDDFDDETPFGTTSRGLSISDIDDEGEGFEDWSNPRQRDAYKSTQVGDSGQSLDDLLREITDELNEEKEMKTKKTKLSKDQFTALYEKYVNKKKPIVESKTNTVSLNDVSKALLVAHKQNEELKKSLNEHVSTINILKNILQETKLLNSKLLYTNKLFKDRSLNEEQKLKIINVLDLAKSEREVKLAYTVLAESTNNIGGSVVKKKKNTTVTSITEGLASKPMASTKPNDKIITENIDAIAARYQVLAGIRKPE